MNKAPVQQLLFGAITIVLLLLAACGDDEPAQDESAGETGATPTQPAPTETEAPATATPEPQPSATATAEQAESSPEPEPEPADDADLAPELAGLTDWRNSEPLALDELRGEPVVLVFWNSI